MDRRTFVRKVGPKADSRLCLQIFHFKCRPDGR
jgi:hypothetical protein